MYSPSQRSMRELFTSSLSAESSNESICCLTLIRSQNIGTSIDAAETTINTEQLTIPVGSDTNAYITVVAVVARKSRADAEYICGTVYNVIIERCFAVFNSVKYPTIFNKIIRRYGVKFAL